LKRVFAGIRKSYKKRKVAMKSGVQRAATKTKWALRGRKSFDELVNNIASSVTDLVELFPAVKPEQAELAKVEAKQVDAQDLKVLAEIAATNEDATLAEAAVQEAEEAKKRDPHLTFRDITITGNVRHFQGQMLREGERPERQLHSGFHASGNTISILGAIPFNDGKNLPYGWDKPPPGEGSQGKQK
jgi:hypothetical protein